MSLKSRISGREQAPVRALLGPTNTGKTHTAIRRMIGHGSGMIGFPLRLLAREVYERVCEAVGPEKVALVTGEEKRIPPGAVFWLCTVEAMPLDKPVAFLAIDEVQLAGDRNRGKVFTDRILHARGAAETLFMGSETIAPLLERLVPEVELLTQPRLSSLTYTGVDRVRSLPPRSAVVAFSTEAVYALAERLKAAHGGTAVVLGALSPRARNAQVQLFQEGSVRHLVATDAIGMGLNLDVTHVSFAALDKFDGHEHRDLSVPELAQIAGRAGRFRTPGTFGTLAPLPELAPGLVEALEQHRFPSLHRLWWRNTDLDFGSIEALYQSLIVPPVSPLLLHAKEHADELVLASMRDSALLGDLVRGPSQVALLWKVCQVPDFRKTRTDDHMSFLHRLAETLLRDGSVPEAQIGRSLERLDRTDGEFDTLMGRMAWIRTWTYITFQHGWLEDSARWQAQAQEIEDRVSDALHEALTARFVDKRALVINGEQPAGLMRLEGEQVLAGELPLGTLLGFSFVPVDGVKGPSARSLLAAVSRQLRADLLARVSACEAAEDGAFSVDAEHRLLWGTTVLGVLVRPTAGGQPELRLLRHDLIDVDARERLRARARRWVAAQHERLVGALTRKAAKGLPPAGKAIVYALERGLGVLPRRAVKAEVELLDEQGRALLAKLDVRVGTESLYIHTALKPDRMAIRAWWWAVQEGVVPTPALPEGAPSSVPLEGAPRDLWELLGYRVIGPRAVRIDVLERWAASLRQSVDFSVGVADPAWLSWLGCSRAELVWMLNAFGYDAQLAGEPEQVLVARRVKRQRRARR